MTEPRTDEPQEQGFQEFAEIGKLAARWLPGRVLEGLGAVPDHAVVRAAAKRVKELEGPAWHCEQVAKTAAQEVERLGKAMTAKAEEVSTVKAEFETVSARLASMPLDSPESETAGGRHRHLELVLRRVEAERDGLQEALASAQQHWEETRDEAQAASARLEIARLGVKKALNQAKFPAIIDWALHVAEDQADLVQRAREMREQFQFAEDPGIARLLPHDSQPRSKGWEALKRFVELPEGGYTLTPSAPRDSFSLLAGNGAGEAFADEPVEPDEIPADAEPDELDEAAWAALTSEEGGTADG